MAKLFTIFFNEPFPKLSQAVYEVSKYDSNVVFISIKEKLPERKKYLHICLAINVRLGLMDSWESLSPATAGIKSVTD